MGWFYKWYLNTLRPKQNCHHFYFADDILKLNKNVWISLKISMKLVRKFRISIIPALDQIMAWHWLGNKYYLNQWWLLYWSIYASLGLNELKPILWIDILGPSCEIGLQRVPWNLVDDRSVSHYLSQNYPRCMSPYGINRLQWVIMFRQRCWLITRHLTSLIAMWWASE